MQSRPIFGDILNQNPLDLIVACVQELSLSRDLASLMFIVRKTARKMTSADGITFVLKDKDSCYYADEDAISPLWKGQRFPAQTCISGWVMHHKVPAIIKDIYLDERIPQEVYRPTFVKSLARIPIRTMAPIGAIGCYWQTHYTPTETEVKHLQALADVTAVSFEKLQVYNYLKEKVGTDVVYSYDTADILFSPQRFLNRIANL